MRERIESWKTFRVTRAGRAIDVDSVRSEGWLRRYLLWTGAGGLLVSGNALPGAVTGEALLFILLSALASGAALWAGLKSADWLRSSPDHLLRGMQLVVVCHLILVPIALVVRDDVGQSVIVDAVLRIAWPSFLYWYAAGLARRRKTELAAKLQPTTAASKAASCSADAEATAATSGLSRAPQQLYRALIRSGGMFVGVFGLFAAWGCAYLQLDAKGEASLLSAIILPGAFAGLYFVRIGSVAIASQAEGYASRAAWRSELSGATYGGATGYVAGFVTAHLGSGWVFGALVVTGMFVGLAVARRRQH